MTKAKERLLKQAIAEIMIVVAEENNLDILSKKAREICLKYFPNAKTSFENEFLTLATGMQQVHFSIESLKMA